MADPVAPKFDPKMIVVLGVMYFSRQIDFKDEEIVYKLQIAFGSVAAVVLGVYYFVYLKINSKNDRKAIWVPPKAKPMLPFGLSPEPEPITEKEYEATTYRDYEVKELKAAAQSIATSVAITYFMSIKFNVHMSLLMQSIMMPFTAYEVLLVKKYIFGKEKSPEGGLLYNESFTAPTAATVAEANRLQAETYAQATGKNLTNGPGDETEPTPTSAGSDKKKD